MGVAEHAVGCWPLQDADLWWGTRGEAVVLDHDGHFRRRFGFSTVEKKNRNKTWCLVRYSVFFALRVNSSQPDVIPMIKSQPGIIKDLIMIVTLN